MKTLASIILPVSVLVCSGCGNVAVNKEATAQLTSVTIKKEVSYGDVAFNNSPGKAMGAVVGGAVGAGMTAAASEDEDDAMKVAIQYNSNLDEIAYKCFYEALQSDPYWSPKLKPDAAIPDATFEITVYLYGFSTYNFLADGAEPAFGLIIKLIDQKNSELWSFGRGVVDYPDGLPRYELDEYFEDLTRYDEAAAALCKQLIPKFMKSLNGK